MFMGIWLLTGVVFVCPTQSQVREHLMIFKILIIKKIFINQLRSFKYTNELNGKYSLMIEILMSKWIVYLMP